jgi:hypothetical protein
MIDEKVYHVPLSIVSVDLPTIGDVSKAFRNAHQISPGCRGNLIQELGLPDPVTKDTSSKEKCEMFIETMTGKSPTVGVYAFTTVSQLRTMIEEQEELPPDQQRSIHTGSKGARQLEDDNTMHDYGIKKEEYIQLVLRLRGGMYAGTSARQDFAILADVDSTQISITLLFPDGRPT